MERPLRNPGSHRGECYTLALALLCSEQSHEAHRQVLREAFLPKLSQRTAAKLSVQTLVWTSGRPPWRAKAIARRLQHEGSAREWWSQRRFVLPPVPLVPPMRRWPGTESLPELATVEDLARWLRLDVAMLGWMADLRDQNRRCVSRALQHYTVRRLRKRDGTERLIEIPKQMMRHVQRQILCEVLEAVDTHEAVHGFRKGRSIRTFAAPHAGSAMVLRLDLDHFFASIAGARVQAMFRSLGYPEAVADLLGGLCTTTTPSTIWAAEVPEAWPAASPTMRDLCRRPHLPQGAPSSPAIANLCAWRMDMRLTGLARAARVTYTRYADDLAFSGDTAFARGAERFAAHVAAIVTEEGFSVNHRKTRYMRASQRQRLAGVVVNQYPTPGREELERLEATLVNCIRRGPDGQNRDGHPDFKAYLEGRVAFVSMLNTRRGEELRELLTAVRW